MYQNFKEIEEKARMLGPKSVAVLFPDSLDVMTAIFEGADQGLIKPILVGDQAKIKAITQQFNIKPNGFEIIDEKGPQKAADICIDMARAGSVAFVVKGNIITSYLYRSLIKYTKAGAPDQIPCTLCFHHADNIKKVFTITDPGVNINPDVSIKRKILKNAINAQHRMGCKNPRIMIISSGHISGAKSKIQKDTDILQQLIKDNKMGRCQLSNTQNLYSEFSNHKVETDNFPDIFLVPNIDTGNILVKSIDHLGGGIRQCVTIGGDITVLTPSRSDRSADRIINLSLGVILSETGGI
ncbi:phosphate acyltransferase [Desulfobacula sp.]|uniref:phosphate acyltransferase n=1 Tax=Desulfobacula sp. TaxID=2593537 RepID=UPI002625AE41|nr:phosphate acyltransferase [Desulfobacula sp.]